MNIVESFKNKARIWAKKVVTLSNTPVTGPLQKEKDSLLKQAKYIKKTIESVFGTIEELENVGLGLAPLIPIAVITSALGAMTYWGTQFAKFMVSVAEQKRLESTGLSPSQAANIISKKSQSEKGFFEGTLLDVKKILPIALLGGGAYYLYKKGDL